MEERTPDNASPQEPTRAIRLIFEYEGDEVRLISQHPVETAFTDPGVSQVEHAAYYVDTRNASGQTLSRVKAHGAFMTSAEVFPEQHGEPITRVDVPNRKGAFTVVAPAHDDTDHVAVLKTPARVVAATGAEGVSPDSAAAEVQEIASFPLSDEIRTKNQGGTP